MSDFLIEHTPSAYKYPLLIKHLLHAPMTQSVDQEIVYRDLSRYTYRDLRERIGRLASGLTSKGVRRGDVVGVLDWDSHRYLESYFAIPMLGATLQTVNIRLSPEQVLFTLNHARPNLLLMNVEFLPLIEQLQGQLGVDAPQERRDVLLQRGVLVRNPGSGRSTSYSLAEIR